MIKPICKWLIALIFAFTSMSSLAQSVADFDVAKISVANQSQGEFQAALPKALDQLLIKISGNPGINTLPSIQEQTQNASAWVKSYSYEKSDSADESSPLVLNVTFDIKSIYQLLRQANQSIWSSNRPKVLVWVTQQTPQGITLLTNSSTLDELQTLKDIAWQRGLMIELPNGDEQDQALLSAQQNNKVLTDAQRSALTQRYGVSTLLSGQLGTNSADDNSLFEPDTNLSDQWQFMLNGDPYQWQSNGTTNVQIISAAINQTANLMANQLAVIEPDQSNATVMIQVDGVSDLSDYAKIMSSLKKLAPVNSVSVAKINAQGVLLKVVSAGGSNSLAQAIAGDSKLMAITNNDTNESHNDESNNHVASLYYHWQDAQQ